MMPVLPQIEAEILGLFAGQPEDRWADRPKSAIGKKLVEGIVEINETGLVPDQQADLRVHGGPEKAIHHYAAEHMAVWQAQFPDSAARFRPGAFGENISTTGIDEKTICLGDVFSLGTARVEICQGRQPCWKLNAHTEIATMAVEFQKSGRTGWYYRVLENGAVRTGDRMRLVARPNPQWLLADIVAARFNAALQPEIAAEIAALPALSQSWREAFLRKAARDAKEDTSLRLTGGYRS